MMNFALILIFCFI